jgi:hypothetical protein
MDLPERLRAIAESLEGDDWEHPITSQETCLKAADVIEKIAAKCGHFAGEVRPVAGSPLRLIVEIANIVTGGKPHVKANEEGQEPIF